MRSIEIELVGFEVDEESFDLNIEYTFGIRHSDFLVPPDLAEIEITEMKRSDGGEPLDEDFVQRFAEDHYEQLLEIADEEAHGLWEAALQRRFEEPCP